MKLGVFGLGAYLVVIFFSGFQSTANDIIDYYQIPAHKITPTLLAFDNQNFREIKTEEPEQNHPYFLYIGRPDPHKNLARLVAAFAQISQAQTYELWLIGSPDPRYTPSLKHQAQELGIGDRVKFLDYVAYDKLPVIINQAVSLVFPSLWEGFGLPVLEAMACGTPVITSDISALPEVAGDAALLVNPYNTKEITAAMESLIGNNQLRQKLKDLGLKRAHNFSWEKTGKQTAEILQKFL